MLKKSEMKIIGYMILLNQLTYGCIRKLIYFLNIGRINNDFLFDIGKYHEWLWVMVITSDYPTLLDKEN